MSALSINLTLFWIVKGIRNDQKFAVWDTVLSEGFQNYTICSDAEVITLLRKSLKTIGRNLFEDNWHFSHCHHGTENRVFYTSFLSLYRTDCTYFSFSTDKKARANSFWVKVCIANIVLWSPGNPFYLLILQVQLCKLPFNQVCYSFSFQTRFSYVSTHF